MGLFTGKTLMITGGTGSFGNAVLNRFLKTDIGEIRIFSRDEKKQVFVYRSSNNKCIAECAHDPIVGSVWCCVGIVADANKHNPFVSGPHKRLAAKCQTDD